MTTVVANDDIFKDIRPYHDQEVPAVLKRLANNQRLICALAQFKFPRLYRFVPGLTRYVIRHYLNQYVKQVKDVNDVQLRLTSYIRRTIETTTDSFTYEGLGQLDASQSYLFISNHRDIVMDPTFVNYALHLEGFPTARIAAGDNLLSEQYIGDLMRLNKTFIVKRSISNRREKLAALTKLSQYISSSVKEGCSIWIAHREGRSKDGIDQTDSAVLKMLQLGQRSETKSFAEAMHNLNIVPVAVSYQYDPCDSMKAHELSVKAETGEYTKAPGEDTSSIVTGIMGQKGKVHVAFGKPLSVFCEDASEMALTIDKQLHRLYQLHDTNYAAAALLEGKADSAINADALAHIRARLEGLNEAEKSQLLNMYANPVLQKEKALAGCDVENSITA
ncbi:1-acyl-sn-glycerol-3-phosphate acyltransferase [Celerinatantimonas sp. YJH-8]|uniref:1-acyl-sn-glycerol-3-phosphate acyltransferase n=1 Tax=Celerinatantimonas sp. YJH-8 TaxID=3228714 RepID=UPI0038C54A5B